MNIPTIAITKFESYMLDRLREHGWISWASTNRVQTAALNRLVNKGILEKFVNAKEIECWKEKK